MAVQKDKKSYSATRMRRSHDALKILGTSMCDNCSALKKAHYICISCGFYRGRNYANILKNKILGNKK